MRATSVSWTRAALPRRRLRFAFLDDSKCRREECALRTLPRAVILNRFATDLRVLLRAIDFGIALEGNGGCGDDKRFMRCAASVPDTRRLAFRGNALQFLPHGEHANGKAACGDSWSGIWWT